VRLDRRHADLQRSGNVRIRQSGADEGEHLAFARGEPGQSRRVGIGPRRKGTVRVVRKPCALDYPNEHTRGQRRFAARGPPYCVDHVARLAILNQEADGASVQGTVDVVVLGVGREHQHVGPGRHGPDAPGRLDAIDLWHTNIHQHHIGPQSLDQPNRLPSVGRLADHLDVGRGLQKHPNTGPDQSLIVHHNGADHAAPRSALAA
jgi:hypothetical protein